MSHQSISLSDRGKRVTAVEVLEKERIDCEKEVVYSSYGGATCQIKKMKPLFTTVMTRKRGNE